MMRRWRVPIGMLVTALLLTAPTWAAKKPHDSGQGHFPAAKGNTWVYEGTVRENFQGDPPISCTVELRRTITDQRSLGEGAYLVSVHQTARMIGDCLDAEEKVAMFESDLLWFMDGVRFRGRKVYEFSRNGVLEGTGHHDLRAVTAAEMREYARQCPPDFILPVAIWQRYPNDPNPLRKDGWDQWVASKGKPVKIGEEIRQDVVTLRYRTGPDDTEVDFIPGVGVARMKYQHKGTIDEWELRLVRYHLTSPQPSPSR